MLGVPCSADCLWLLSNEDVLKTTIDQQFTIEQLEHYVSGT